MTIHMARLETRNYTFDALAATPKDAIHAVRGAWERHQQETGATLTWGELSGSVQVRTLRPGVGYRDGELVRGLPEAKAVGR